MESDMGVTTNNAPDYTGSDYGFVVSEDDQTQLGGSDYIGPKDQVRINKEIINRKNDYDSWQQKTLRAVKTGAALFSISNPFGLAKFAYDQNKKKNERIAEIDADLALLDKIGATKFTPHTDTIYQTLEQEKLDLTQPRSRDDNNDNDGPEEIIAPIPVINEINKEFIDFNLMSALDKIRANQARRSGLVANEIIQDNNQIMTANKGGLAGLFKVKTQ
jgi:hypothetical protein